MGDTQHPGHDASDGGWFFLDDMSVTLTPGVAHLLGCAEGTEPIEHLIARFESGSAEHLREALNLGGFADVTLAGRDFRISVSPADPRGFRAGQLRPSPAADASARERSRHRRQLELLANISPVGLMLLDPQGQPEFANVALHRILGLPDAGTDAELAESFIHTDDADRINQSFGAYLASDGDEWTDRYRVMTQDGEVVEVESRCLRERDDDGTTVGFVSYVLPLSGPRARDVEESDEGDPLALGRVGHWSWNLARETLTFSDSMREIYGIPHDAQLTADFASDKIPPIQFEMMQREITRAAAEDRSWEFEHDIVFPDGTTKRVLSRGRSLRRGTETYYAGTVIDVTEQREREQKVRQAEKLRAIGQLASGVAHDFNNMLGAIVGNATVLAEEVGPELQRPVAEIQVAAERVTRLTRQLLTFSRHQQIERGPANIHELIDEVYTLVAHSFTPQITVKRKLFASKSMVVADASQLQSAFLNLLVNARDALAGSAGTLEIVTRNVQDDGHDQIEIVFADDGPGMDDDTRRRAFEPFFTTRRESGGTGLGLSATYGAILRHGGTIELDTEPGRGAVFTIRLDLMSQESDEDVASDRDRRFDGSGSTVWVVDDEPLMRSLAARVLRRAKFTVEVFESGDEVLRALARSTPDMFVIDHHMPGISGTELIRRLRRDGFDQGIVVVTGNAFELEQGWAEGFDVKAVVEKPYAVADLLSAVSDA